MTRKALQKKGVHELLNSKVDIFMLQEHKLRGRALENLGCRLMPGCANWILKATPGERSWLNPNAAGKGGVWILLSHKYARLVIENRALYNNKVVWIKLEGIGCNIGIACIYAPNIPTERKHLWHLIVDYLPKDCEWDFGGDFNMIERIHNKSNDWSPRTQMELLHLNIWWSNMVELINNRFTYTKVLDLYCKGIQCVDDMRDNEQRRFFSLG